MSTPSRDAIARSGAAAASGAAAPAAAPSTSLRHVDDFLALACSPALLSLRLFPAVGAAKEISECVAAVAALRRHVLPSLPTPLGRGDAIVCVGDGSRPRTAALAAFLLRGSEGASCFSVDPMLHCDTAARLAFLPPASASSVRLRDALAWRRVRGLTIVRARIQDVTVRCQRAVIVMMHAHVTVEDAAAAVVASHGIVGLVTCPCCDWEPHQRELRGLAPAAEFVDLSLISDKRTLRVWHGEALARATMANELPSPLPPVATALPDVTGPLVGPPVAPEALRLWRRQRERAGEEARARRLWPRLCALGAVGFRECEVGTVGIDSPSRCALPSEFHAAAEADQRSGASRSLFLVAGVVGRRPRVHRQASFADIYDLPLEEDDVEESGACPPAALRPCLFHTSRAWASVGLHAHRDAIHGRSAVKHGSGVRVVELPHDAAASEPQVEAAAAAADEARAGRLLKGRMQLQIDREAGGGDAAAGPCPPLRLPAFAFDLVHGDVVCVAGEVVWHSPRGGGPEPLLRVADALLLYDASRRIVTAAEAGVAARRREFTA